MPLERHAPSNNLFAVIGRNILRRLEMPLPSYEKRIINNLVNLYRVIQPGDVLLVEGRSKLSQIIQLLTKSSWSHAALYVGNRLKDTEKYVMEGVLNRLDETDRQHILIEADALPHKNSMIE